MITTEPPLIPAPTAEPDGPPSPSANTLAIGARSTCDELLIGVYNGTSGTIDITWTVTDQPALTYRLRPAEQIPINEPAQPGLTIAIAADADPLARIAWQQPTACPTGTATTAAAAAPPPPPWDLADPRTAALGAALGAALILIGAAGIGIHRLRQRAHHRAPHTKRP
jgi:hypothetical protein